MAFDFLKNMLHARRIVLVDDDPNILRIFADVLRKKGYDVLAAASLGALGDLGELGKVDLFLLDCFLKEGPSGPEIAVLLRNAKYTAPICFVTAQHLSLQQEKNLRSVTDHVDFLEKPVSPSALLAKVDSLT